jgi:DnaK suppressor protein
MDRQRLEGLRARLEKRRGELLELARRNDAGIAEIRGEREIEFGDEAQSEEAQDRMARIGEAERSELKRIEAALERVAAGTYGTCAECGEAIDLRRLEAAPFALLCADCANLSAAAPRRPRA